MDAPDVLQTGRRLLLVKLGKWVDHDDQELPRSGYGVRPGMSRDELYTSARAWWVVSRPRAQRCEYLVAVHDGITVGAWRIDHTAWRSWDFPTVGSGGRRWALTGEPVDATTEADLVGRLVPKQRADGRAVFGTGSVVAYWPR